MPPSIQALPLLLHLPAHPNGHMLRRACTPPPAFRPAHRRPPTPRRQFVNESGFEPASAYYSLDLPGAAHIVSLNNYLPWGKESAQYKWLLQDLASGGCLGHGGSASRAGHLRGWLGRPPRCLLGWGAGAHTCGALAPLVERCTSPTRGPTCQNRPAAPAPHPPPLQWTASRPPGSSSSGMPR